jgi:hypothetical protein
VDTVSPQVFSVNPISGAVDVDVAAPVIITFSETIITDTFAYTVTPDPGDWIETWSNGGAMVTLTHTRFWR